MYLIGNGIMITRDAVKPLIADGCLVVDGNLIKEVGTTAELKAKYPKAQFMDAKGRLIMPGMIDTHMHYYSTFARGWANSSPTPSDFMDILKGTWWKLDKELTLEDVYYSAMAPLIDSVRAGVTTVFDHHASPHAILGSLGMIAEAAEKVGVRSNLCYELSDRDGEKIADQGIRENAEFIAHCASRKDDMLKAMFGLHASFTVSDKTLEKAIKANPTSDAGFHVHTAEGPDDEVLCEKEHGKRIVERFRDFGILGPKTIAVHCVHVDDREIEILAETKTQVVHNPESNMGNAVGCSRVLDFFKAGINVGLGTDGYTCDMLESFKVENIIHKHVQKNPSVAWGESATMLFENNIKICNEYIEKPIGRLAAGFLADIILVDYEPWTPLNENNINSHLLFGCSGSHVNTTIINGKVVYKDREMQTVDVQEVMGKGREVAARLWKRL
ncbi:MAG: putative aminohydrolase SsnA [Clostridia bacterium]